MAEWACSTISVQAKQLRDLWLKEDEMMNSHDVVSLFTNVTINTVIAVIRKWPEGDKFFKNRTNVIPDDVMLTYFQFDGKYYQQVGQQVHGAPMGSTVSFVVVDMYMSELENEAMDTAPQDIRLSMWRWYIRSRWWNKTS